MVCEVEDASLRYFAFGVFCLRRNLASPRLLVSFLVTKFTKNHKAHRDLPVSLIDFWVTKRAKNHKAPAGQAQRFFMVALQSLENCLVDFLVMTRLEA